MASERREIGQWTIADDGEIVDVHSGEQMASTFGDRKLAEHIVEAVSAYRAAAVPDTGHLDLDDVLQRHRNVARALSENGTSEETLQGWHAFAGWLRNGMPDEPDVRGPVPGPVAVGPFHVWFVPGAETSGDTVQPTYEASEGSGHG